MNRLDDLLLLWQDQSIAEDELTELKQLLATPEGRSRLAEDFFLTGIVLEALQTQKAAQSHPESQEEMSASSAAGTRPFLRGNRRALHKRIVWLSATAAALLVVLGASFWFRPPPSPTPPAPSPVPATAFAQFEQVQGKSFVVSNERRLPAQAGQVLVPGEGIATEGVDSEAVVQMKDAVRLRLGGDTMVFTTTDADEPNAGNVKVVLEQGDLLVEATRSLRRKKMTVQTPLGVAVSEREETALHVSDAAGVVVVRGAVNFTHKTTGKSILVQGGEYVAATASGDLYTARVFSGNASVWTTFPRSGLETSSVGYRVMFSPNGKMLAAVGRSGEGGVRLGSMEDPSTPRELRGERCAAFSPDGKLLAAPSQGNVLLYDVPSGEQLHILSGKDRRMRVVCLAFSPDGKRLAVGRSGPRDAGSVEIWDLATRTIRTTCGEHAGPVTSVDFSPDGKFLASGSLDQTVVLWDLAGERVQARISSGPSLVVWSLSFAPDGKTLAIATGPGDFRLRQPGEVLLWDVDTEKIRTRLYGHTRAVTSVIFSADGQTMITGSADTTVRFWDLATAREYGMLKGHGAAPGFEAVAVALSPRGDYLATASYDRTVKIWKTTWINEVDSRISALAHLRQSPLAFWHRLE